MVGDSRSAAHGGAKIALQMRTKVVNAIVYIGRKVRFEPQFMVNETHKKPAPVIGAVSYINEKNGYFVAEYAFGDTKLREGFQFADIGKDVELIDEPK